MGYLLGRCRPPDFHRGSIKARGSQTLELVCWCRRHSSSALLQGHGGSSQLELQRPHCNETTPQLLWHKGRVCIHSHKIMLSVFLSSFLLLSSPFREPKGQRNKHCCTTNSGDCSARIHRMRNLKDTKKRFYRFFPPFFLILNVSQNVAEPRQMGITCDSPPQEGSYYSKGRAFQS